MSESASISAALAWCVDLDIDTRSSRSSDRGDLPSSGDAPFAIVRYGVHIRQSRVPFSSPTNDLWPARVRPCRKPLCPAHTHDTRSVKAVGAREQR